MPTVTLPSGLTLSYAEQGDAAAPALLMLPGPTDSWRSYETVLDRLPRGIRALAVSPRGHGDSDKPQRGYRVEDYAGDVVPLLDALGIERAVLAGHSGSCLVARGVAVRHPDRVAGLVLEASPTTLRDDPTLRAFVESVVADLDDPISPTFARSFVGDTSSERVPPELIARLTEEIVKVPARVWKETFEDLLRYDDTSTLGLIEAPTLLVWGDADGLVSRNMQHELAGAIPGAALVVYPGLGHTPRWEDPDRFTDDLVGFVERVTRVRR
jgi:pimeloyl-ACP methyl ester carboxylesterase